MSTRKPSPQQWLRAAARPAPRSFPNDLHALERVLGKLRKAHPRAEVRICYEAGPTGFVRACFLDGNTGECRPIRIQSIQEQQQHALGLVKPRAGHLGRTAPAGQRG